VEAANPLGHILLDGKLAEKDALEALRLFTKAAEAGHPPSLVDLGLTYTHGNGVQRDLVRAAMWYKRAADLGNAYGMTGLALLYVQGRGVQRDDVAAVVLNRKAVSLGNAMAMNNLAWMLQGGRGVERKQPDEAAELMIKSLDRRNEFSRQRMTQYSNTWSKEFRHAMQSRLWFLLRVDRRPLSSVHHQRDQRR
jgi:TPR repeat protein